MVDGISANYSFGGSSEVRPPLLAAAEEEKVSIYQKMLQDLAKSSDGKGTTVERTAEEAPDPKIVKEVPHKIPKGFYPAAKNGNPRISGNNGILANDGAKIREAADPAGFVAETVLDIVYNHATPDGLSKNQLRRMLIAANPSVFEKNGALKKNAQLGKLDLPTVEQMRKAASMEPPKRTIIPKGFKPVFADNRKELNSLTEARMRAIEGQENGAVGAVQVLNALLDTPECKYITGERRAALLNDLVLHNPSVFEKDGSIKRNADFMKLDAPRVDHIWNNYAKKDGDVAFNMNPNGYYTLGSGDNTKYFRADGTPIERSEYESKCS